VPRVAVDTPEATAVGPYSQAIDTGDLVLLSGQTPLDPDTGALVEGGIEAQTRQCLVNLFAVLAAAGLSPAAVAKCTVYLTDMADFAAMNAEYARHFDQPYPARTTIGVAALPLGAAIEIEVIAENS
jgi:2-iminobutanoate/2-iminopropanoate deaminase